MPDKSLEVINNNEAARVPRSHDTPWHLMARENHRVFQALRNDVVEDENRDTVQEGVVILEGVGVYQPRPVSIYGEPRLNAEDFRKVLKLRIKQARKNLGETQGSMARQIGVKEPTYAKWENTAVGMIPLHYLPLFCELTGVCPTKIIYPYLTDMERRLLNDTE